MTTKPAIGVMICLGALLSLTSGEPPSLVPSQAPIHITIGDAVKTDGAKGVSITILVGAGDAARSDDHGPKRLSISNLMAQLAGSNWEADPPSAVRPGLYPTLKFNRDNVEPANYRFEINPHDFTVRIFFNHGDTQLMLLSDNGRRLSFTFQGKDYSYVLTSL
jgi:hypothetical protein